MPSHRVLCAVLLSSAACASTGTINVDRDSAPRAKVQLAPLIADETTRLLPTAVEPALPSADRISHIIEARLGSQATVDVRYCVSPAGRLVSTELERSSTLDAFDRAVMTDMATWQFASKPGTEDLRTCETATIVYRPHS